MNLEPLDLAAVQKQLEPHVSPQVLAMARRADERALLLDIEESANYRRWLLEQQVRTWNLLVELDKAMKPILTIYKVSKWIAASASGIAAVGGAFLKWKGGHKP